MKILLNLVDAASLLTVIPVTAQTLLLRYNFDEASSGNAAANDSGQAPAANGTFQGNATRTSTTPGGFSTGALDVSTSALTDYVSGGDADKLDQLSQMTLTGWLNLRASPSFADRIMGKFAAGTFDGWDWTISVATAPQFRFNLVVGASGSSALASSPTTMDANERWIFIATTYDGTQSADNVKFYSGDETNAVVELNTATLDRGATPASTAAFRVASTSASSADRTPPAYLDDLRVYSGILTLSQLEVIRQANLPSVLPPAEPVQILNPVRNGGNIEFSFATQSGRSHIVEYKTNLNDSAWAPLTTVVGTGSNTNITDSLSSSTARYYRVSTQ